MPGFNGTGPNGMGPMTGGGRGFCAVPAGNTRMGMGRNMRRGMGMGRGRNMNFQAIPPQTDQDTTFEDLKAQAQSMSEQLAAIQQRLEELGK